jgi:hypothetical protein
MPEIKNIGDRIMLILERCGEFKGTENLARELALPNNKTYVIRSARRLASNDEITIRISRGGRGYQTIYKRMRAKRITSRTK